MGMPALALTDHGVMYGVVEFYKEARKNGVKPILGCEVYVAPRTRFDREPGRDDSPFHLVLLAENEKGYKNLLEIVTRAHLEGFYYKPRVDKDLLQQFREGLIACSGCLAGEVSRKLLSGQISEAYRAAENYRDIFGPRNFFLEMQNHGLQVEENVNIELAAMGRKMGLSLVATNDVHYLNKEQAPAHDVLLCIQTGKTLQDTERLRFPNAEFYFKSPEEMHDIFQEYPEALANTLHISERCNVNLSFSELHLPDFSVPRGKTADEYLRELCLEGLKKRYGSCPEYLRERMEYELQVIKNMGYSGYFLIVWDLVNFARKQGIPVGPGRGSAAGSLVSYALGITNVDPDAYGLLFERFLNPERVNMPDIDIDLCFERRWEVLDYVTRKYGKDHVAQIITFGTMAAKAAIRDVGRVLSLPLPEVDRVAKQVPEEPGIDLERSLKASSDLRLMYLSDQKVKQLLDMAREVEGTPRHVSTHAAGIVISREPLVHYLPLQRGTEGAVTTQFSMQAVEEIGLLKMDLLGLRTLTVLGRTSELIYQKKGKKIDLDLIPLNDSDTFELLSRGESTGIFQFESDGMRQLLKRLRPERFEDLIALVALYRPGPLGSGMVDDFIRRKHGEIEVEYPHPALKSILEETYGVILYQEQVMKLAGELAGFSMGQADLLRRAMGKKKPGIIEDLKQNFIVGAVKKGLSKDKASEIFELIAHFAGYGFNKSHSAAYALVAYQTAYFKTHYAVEFMASLLTSVMENLDKVPLYIEECRRLGIEILPPDVNESEEDFSVSENNIRFGLAAIKNVGKGPIESILKARREGGKFTSLEDFCERVDLQHLNKKTMESLIKCGAFQSLDPNRASLLAVMDECMNSAHRIQEDRRRGQVTLFDLVNREQGCRFHVKKPDIPELSQTEILSMEKELLGFYISGHPTKPYQALLEAFGGCKIVELQELPDESMVKIGGVISNLRRTITKKGQNMAYLTLEDISGAVECLVFPRVYLEYNRFLEKGRVALISGRLKREDDENPRIFAEIIKILSKPVHKKLFIKISENEQLIRRKVLKVLQKYPGPIPVYIYIASQKQLRALNFNYWVNWLPDLEDELSNICGKKGVRLVDGNGRSEEDVIF